MLTNDQINRLLLSKLLYMNGCEVFSTHNHGSEGMAVLALQDAVEMFLRTVAEYYDASISPTENFDKIVQKIDEAPKNISKTLVPRRTALFKLNKARVNFKHFGLLPVRGDVESFCGEIDLFLREASNSLFKLDFDTISLADFIKHRRTQNKLRAAERALQNAEYREAVEFSAMAFTLYRKFFERYSYRDYVTPPNRHLDESIKNELKSLQSRVERHNNLLELLSYGIDIAHYARFSAIAPGVIITAAKTLNIAYPQGMIQQHAPSDAAFCVAFSLKACVAMQNYHGPRYNRFHHNTEEIEVCHDSPIVVCPDEEPKEVIRIAKASERLIRLKEMHSGFYAGYTEIIEDGESAYIADVALIP